MRPLPFTIKSTDSERPERHRGNLNLNQFLFGNQQLIRLFVALAAYAVAASPSEVRADHVNYSGNATFYISSSSSDPFSVRPSDWNGSSAVYLPMSFSITIDDAPSPLLSTTPRHVRPNVSTSVNGSITIGATVIDIVELTRIIITDYDDTSSSSPQHRELSV